MLIMLSVTVFTFYIVIGNCRSDVYHVNAAMSWFARNL